MEAAGHRPITLAIVIALILHLIFLYYYFTFEVRKNTSPLWMATDDPAFVMLDMPQLAPQKDDAFSAPPVVPPPAAQQHVASSMQQQSTQAQNTTLQQPPSGFNDSPWNVHTDDEVLTLDGAIVDSNSFKAPVQDELAEDSPSASTAAALPPASTLLQNLFNPTGISQNDDSAQDGADEDTEDAVSVDNNEAENNNIPDHNAALAIPSNTQPASAITRPVMPKDNGLVSLEEQRIEKATTLPTAKDISKETPQSAAPQPVVSKIATRQIAPVAKRSNAKKQQSKQLAQLANAFSQSFDQRKQQSTDVTVQRAKVMAQRVGEFKAVSYFQKVYQSLYESFMRSDPVTVDAAIQKVIKMVVVINKNGKPIDVQLPMRTGCLAVDNHIISTIQRTRFPIIPDHLNRDTVTLPCEAFVNLPPGSAVINFHYR